MDFPSTQVLAEVVRRSAVIRHRLGDEIGTRRLVLPTGRDFPDAFAGDEASLQRLVRRLQSQAGIEDIPIEPRMIIDEEHEASSSCGSGACSTPRVDAPTARLEETEGGWRLNVMAQELMHPAGLTCNLARALSHVFLIETAESPKDVEAPVEITADIVGVQLGWGALLLQGSYVYSKSCGGPRIGKLTALGVGELAFAVAFVATANGQRWQDVAGHVDVTQKAALAEAGAIVASNDALVSRFRQAPHSLTQGGSVKLLEARSWLARTFGKKRPSADEAFEAALAGAPVDMALPGAARALPTARKVDPAREELKALVADALSQGE